MTKVGIVPDKLCVYLAGPMRGLPDFNFPAFGEAAVSLRGQGFIVKSPAENEDLDTLHEHGPKEFRHYMEHYLPEVCRSHAVVVLPGWQKSIGAQLEIYVAEAVGVLVWRYPDLSPLRHPASRRFHANLAAAGLLYDERQQEYGTDDDPFANVRAAEGYGVESWKKALIDASDALRRMENHARGRLLRSGKPRDAMLDAAVWALIGLALFEEREEEHDDH